MLRQPALKGAIALALAASAVIACSAKGLRQQMNAPISLCEFARGSTRTRTVTLRAKYISDRQEHSSLSDPNCPQVIALPYEDKAIPKDAGYQQFSRIVDANALRIGLVKANVVAIGRLQKVGKNRFRFDIQRYLEARSAEQ
jgi:hypothetical protein